MPSFSRSVQARFAVRVHDSIIAPGTLRLMALVFHRVSAPPLHDFDAAAPDGVVIGVIGEDGAGKGRLLRLASGLDKPASGAISAPRPARLIRPDDQLDLGPAAVLCIEHTLARHDAIVRERAAIALDGLRR